MTAHSTLETALEAMRGGAYDFVTKPFATAEIRALVHKALEKRAIVAENRRLRAQLAHEQPRDLARHSEPMRRIVDLVRRVATTRSTVLITGESGTGKERIARAVHDLSDRASKPFLVVNCGAIPEALMESELFGHDRGAFTGATSRHPGSFARPTVAPSSSTRWASSPHLQVKLLRVLQERKVRSVGASARVERRRAHPGRDEPQRRGRREGWQVSPGPLLPPEHHPNRGRAAARSGEDIADLAELLPEAVHGGARQGDPRILGGRPPCARCVCVPRECARAREHRGARGGARSSNPIIGLGDLPFEVGGSTARPTPALMTLPDEGCQLGCSAGRAGTTPHPAGDRARRRGRTEAAKLLGVSLRSLRYRLQKLSMGDVRRRGLRRAGRRRRGDIVLRAPTACDSATPGRGRFLAAPGVRVTTFCQLAGERTPAAGRIL